MRKSSLKVLHAKAVEDNQNISNYTKSLKIPKKNYFENKTDLTKIAEGQDLDDFESFTELIKVETLNQTKENIYYHSSEFNHTLEFLVYKNNKLYVHSRGLPILKRKYEK